MVLPQDPTESDGRRWCQLFIIRWEGVSSCFSLHHPLLSDKRRLCYCGTQAGGLEIKACTVAGSVPGLCSYHPRWEQGEGRAAAAVFPQELFLGFSFISSKTRVTGEGSKDSRRLKGGGESDWECLR